MLVQDCEMPRLQRLRRLPRRQRDCPVAPNLFAHLDLANHGQIERVPESGRLVSAQLGAIQAA